MTIGDYNQTWCSDAEKRDNGQEGLSQGSITFMSTYRIYVGP